MSLFVFVFPAVGKGFAKKKKGNIYKEMASNIELNVTFEVETKKIDDN